LAQSRPGRAVSGLLLGVLGAVVALFVVGAFVSVAVGGKAGSGAVTPSRAEPSMVATYPGAPVPSSSESESAGPASSNSTSR
jgi:hypothetical protein